MTPSGRRVVDSSDIGFAVVELLELDIHPFLEVLLTARERSPTNEQATQLLLFLQRVLDSDQAANGFGLTYDFRLLQNPSVKVLLTIAKWGAVPERQALFLQRCIACKACVPSGWKFSATKAAMTAFFTIAPPTCTTYLVSDFGGGGQEICFPVPSARPVPTQEACDFEDGVHVAAMASRPSRCMGSLRCDSCFAFLQPRPVKRAQPDKERQLESRDIIMKDATEDLDCSTPELRQALRTLVKCVQQELNTYTSWHSSVYQFGALCFMAYCARICSFWQWL